MYLLCRSDSSLFSAALLMLRRSMVTCFLFSTFVINPLKEWYDGMVRWCDDKVCKCEY